MLHDVHQPVAICLSVCRFGDERVALTLSFDKKNINYINFNAQTYIKKTLIFNRPELLLLFRFKRPSK